MNVLIIEDEVKIAQVLVDYFRKDGFTCTVLADGTDAVEVIRTGEPDFVVLDWMLPGKDGLSICREVRQFSEVPILILTAKVDEIDRLLGLRLGADDYVCKPFSPREVVARARTILRRAQAGRVATDGPTYNYRGICVFEDRYVCQAKGTQVELTPVEFRLLCTLISVPQRVWTRQQLMESSYDKHHIVSGRTIDSHVKNLRKKLAAHMGEDVLHSVYGVGYKLV